MVESGVETINPVCRCRQEFQDMVHSGQLGAKSQSAHESNCRRDFDRRACGDQPSVLGNIRERRHQDEEPANSISTRG